MSMPMPPGMAPPGPKPKPKGAPKLFTNDRGSKVLKGINGIYRVFWIIKNFSGKFLWYSSCVMVLYLLPSQILLLRD